MWEKSLSLSFRQDLLISATCNLCPEGFWPFVNVVVVGLEDVGRCFQQFRKVEGDPDVNEVRRGRVFSGRAKKQL